MEDPESDYLLCTAPLLNFAMFPTSLDNACDPAASVDGPPVPLYAGTPTLSAPVDNNQAFGLQLPPGPSALSNITVAPLLPPPPSSFITELPLPIVPHPA